MTYNISFLSDRVFSITFGYNEHVRTSEMCSLYPEIVLNWYFVQRYLAVITASSIFKCYCFLNSFMYFSIWPNDSFFLLLFSVQDKFNSRLMLFIYTFGTALTIGVLPWIPVFVVMVIIRVLNGICIGGQDTGDFCLFVFCFRSMRLMESTVIVKCLRISVVSYSHSFTTKSGIYWINGDMPYL